MDSEVGRFLEKRTPMPPAVPAHPSHDRDEPVETGEGSRPSAECVTEWQSLEAPAGGTTVAPMLGLEGSGPLTHEELFG